MAVSPSRQPARLSLITGRPSKDRLNQLALTNCVCHIGGRWRLRLGSWGAVCLPIPRAASIVGTGDIFGDRLAEPIHILWHGARLSKRHCDAGFVEGIEDGDP